MGWADAGSGKGCLFFLSAVLDSKISSTPLLRECWEHKSVLCGCVPEALALKCLLHIISLKDDLNS